MRYPGWHEMDGPDTSAPHDRSPAREPEGPDGGAASSETARPSSWAPIVAEAERAVLRWILDTTRSACRAPIDDEVLIQFQQPSLWLSGLCDRGLLNRRLHRVHLTRNAVRLADGHDPIAELLALRVVASAARELWLSTRVAMVGVDEFARHAGLDPTLLSIALTMGPGPLEIELDRGTGLAASIVLGDHLVAIPEGVAQMWSGAACEYEPPRSLTQLAARFRAGEVEFPRIEIIEGGSVRQIGDIGPVCEGLDLGGLVVRSGCLRACSLSLCNLRGVVFEALDLGGTLLSACDLEGACLRSVSTPYASFLGCNLADLNLDGVTTFYGAWIQGSAFTGSTAGLRERILGCSLWQQVWIDGRSVTPADLDAEDPERDVEPPTPAAEAPPADNQSSTTAHAPDRAEAPEATDSLAPRDGRLSFRPRQRSKNFDIVAGDEVVADAGPGDVVGLRFVRLLAETRSVVHALDLCASVDGESQLRVGPLPLEEERVLARSIAPRITITDETDVEKRHRRAAILRRLVTLVDLLPSTAEGRQRNVLERERLELEAALGTPDYRAGASGRGGDDAVAKAAERVTRAIRRWQDQLQKNAPEVAAVAEASIERSKNGEFWRWIAPAANAARSSQ